MKKAQIERVVTYLEDLYIEKTSAKQRAVMDWFHWTEHWYTGLPEL